MSGDLYLGDRVYWAKGVGSVRHNGRHVSIRTCPRVGKDSEPVFIDYAPGVYEGEIQENFVSQRRNFTKNEEAWLKWFILDIFNRMDKIIDELARRKDF